jgi:hypothetical protein
LKYSLLDLTQRILQSIKGEEVNTISDTAESLAVVGIIKECYYTLIAEKDLPEQKTLFQLDASGDNTKPVLMTIPDDVYALEWVRYNVADTGDSSEWREMEWLSLDDFLYIVGGLDSTATYVDEMTISLKGDNLVFKYRNDVAPRFYTTIDDTRLLFDAYDNTNDTTLQSAKTQCYGVKLTAWSDTDDFELELDAQQYVMILKEAKTMAWQELKSIDNVLAAKQARQIRIQAESKKNRANYKKFKYYYDQYPNYGRK